MTPAEASYFDGHPCAHVAAFYEHQENRRKLRMAQRAAERDYFTSRAASRFTGGM